MRRIYQWYLGYLFIYLRGMNQERFINLCANHGIRLWDLQYQGCGYQCKINLNDYKKLKPMVRKCNVLPLIKRRCGFPFYMFRCRKQFTFLAGIIMFCYLVWLASGCLWNISFEGTYQHTNEQMFSCINDLGIYAGMRLSEVDCAELETKIRGVYTDIGWVSAELKGTHLIIKIKETSQPLAYTSSKETDYQEAHIVAGKDGIVTDIVTRKGIAMVKSGDVVHKGQVLISGVMKVVGDNDLLLRKYPLLSDGDVMIKTYYDYEYQFPQQYQMSVKTGNEKTGYDISMFGKKIFSYNPSNYYETCDIISEVKGLRLFGSFYLPFTYTKKTVVELKELEAVYSEQEMLALAEQRLDRYIEKLTANGAKILTQEVETWMEGTKCVSKGRIFVEEPAWNYEEILEEEWRDTITDEYHRDNN